MKKWRPGGTSKKVENREIPVADHLGGQELQYRRQASKHEIKMKTDLTIGESMLISQLLRSCFNYISAFSLTGRMCNTPGPIEIGR